MTSQTTDKPHQGFYLTHIGMVNCLGSTPDEIYSNMMDGDRSGFVQDSESVPEATLPKGSSRGELPPVPKELVHYDSRNNRLILAALRQIEEPVRQAMAAYGPENVGVVLGSSTSGIREGEQAIEEKLDTGDFPESFLLCKQGMGFPAEFIAAYFGLGGPAYTISSACTSSAKAMISARNLLASGTCKAVITGGSDSLCRLTLNGFFSLETLSRTQCNPMSKNRDGIVIGEASALFLMTREGPGIQFLGGGESSDAHHISAPEPEGTGAEAAMRAALQDAELEPGDIAYINLHGTATRQNDAMESKAVHRLFGSDVPCSSTKALTGHTLGAAGATEAALCWLALDRADDTLPLPPHFWDGQVDEALAPIQLAQPKQSITFDDARAVLSNSFAFGGNNCCIVLSKEQAKPDTDAYKQFAVQEILPHSGRMILLDEICGFTNEHTESLATVRPTNIFYDPERKGVPVWIGYEYMAQTMAAYMGIKARLKKEPVNVGLLVGNRNGTCHVPYFKNKQQLHTIVHFLWEADGLGVFDCKIEDAHSDACLMEAVVNVYLPADLDNYLKGARGA